MAHARFYEQVQLQQVADFSDEKLADYLLGEGREEYQSALDPSYQLRVIIANKDYQSFREYTLEKYEIDDEQDVSEEFEQECMNAFASYCAMDFTSDVPGAVPFPTRAELLELFKEYTKTERAQLYEAMPEELRTKLNADPVEVAVTGPRLGMK